MSPTVVVIGAGGFGRETLDVLDAQFATGKPGNGVRGVVDDEPSDLNLQRLRERGIRYLGTLDAWLGSDDDSEYLIAIGSPAVRARVAARCDSSGRTAAVAVHPAATLGSNVVLGRGTIICAGAQVSTNVVLGGHVHVNPNATIGHDAVLDDFASINPSATISGETHLARRVLVGASAVILQGLSIGEGSVIGAAACVTKDVGAGVTAKGVPAR